MVRQDIVAGLKNAIERGSSLEQAKHSFISAGYSREDVEEASQFIHSGSSLIQEKPETALQMPKPITAIQPSLTKSASQPTPKTEQLQKPETFRKNFKVIILIIILMILVAILILTIVFREKILEWFA